MAKSLYKEMDKQRLVGIKTRRGSSSEPYRSVWRRDYARLIHSPAFRRLQGKPQLYPNHESDFFRNRLTHSLEVAQIAKSIAIRINGTNSYFRHRPIDTDLVELAGLAHDLGHPPFGHNGEAALDECMEGDGGFEGNAQTLRILSKLEKRQTKISKGNLPICVDDEGKDARAGLNFTFRSLACVLKYDHEIKRARSAAKGLEKGYYYTERELVREIKQHVCGDKSYKNFKTVECYIMDVADDIAYSTYDLEDSFKGGFLSPLRMIAASPEVMGVIADEVKKAIQKTYPHLKSADKKFSAQDAATIIQDIFSDMFTSDERTNSKLITNLKNDPVSTKAYVASEAFSTSRGLADNGYLRSDETSRLVGQFIRGINVDVNKDCPALSRVYLDFEVFKRVEVLKHFTFKNIIMSSMLKVAEYRGKEIVRNLFQAFLSQEGHALLPEDYQEMYKKLDSPSEKRRAIADFIAGMTDRYALEFHGRLFSPNPESIWKPL